MSTIARPDARAFVREVEIPAPPRARVRRRGAATDQPAAVTAPLEEGKKQAAVVGSDVVAFVQGVTTERREAIVNSALLAQLAASKQVPDRTRIYDWYTQYFKVLEHIGWATQEVSFAEYTESAHGLEAHEAILKVATALLTPGTAALALVTTTINALKSMQEDSPWITIFNRETEHAQTAHFQVTLVDQAPDGQFLVSIMAFGLVASSSITQVLFFKVKKSEASLKHYAGKVTINAGVLDHVKDELQTRLKKYADDFIAALPAFD